MGLAARIADVGCWLGIALAFALPSAQAQWVAGMTPAGTNAIQPSAHRAFGLGQDVTIYAQTYTVAAAGSAYVAGDQVTLTCSGATATTSPIVTVNVASGANFNVGFVNTGVFTVIPATATSTCSQASTTGVGTGLQLSVSFVPVTVPGFSMGLGVGGGSANANTFFGAQTPNPLLAGSENSYFGDSAGHCNIGVSRGNTLVGLAGGAYVEFNVDPFLCSLGTWTGSFNTVLGNDAGRNFAGVQVSNNTLVGQNTGRTITNSAGTQGNNNTIVGQGSYAPPLAADTPLFTGQSNTILGQGAAKTVATGSNNLILSAGVGAASTTLVSGGHNVIISTRGADTVADTTGNTVNLEDIMTTTGTGTPSTSLTTFPGNVTISGLLTQTLPSTTFAARTACTAGINGNRAIFTDIASIDSTGFLVGGGSATVIATCNSAIGKYEIPSLTWGGVKMVQKTGDYGVLATESGTHFNNAGAGAQVNFTLPTAASGLRYCFDVVAAQTLVVTASGTNLIAVGATQSAAGGNLTSTARRSAVCMEAVDTAQWITTSLTDQWTVN